MKLPLSLSLAAVLVGGSLLPASAEAAKPKSSHREDHYRFSHRHHHRDSYLVKVWIPGHSVRHHGHRDWVPGHYEWRRVYR